MATKIYMGLGLAAFSAGIVFAACGPSADDNDKPGPSSPTVTPNPTTPNPTATGPDVTSPNPSSSSPSNTEPNACDGPGDAYQSMLLNNDNCETTAPPNCIINQFGETFACTQGGGAPGVGDCPDCCWGDDTSLTGGNFTYTGGDPDTLTFTHNASAETVTLTGTIEQYAGFGMWFGPCTDASMWDGIEVQVTGTLGGAKLYVQLQTDEDHPEASCKYSSEETMWTDCANPQAEITEVTGEGFNRLPWSAFSGGLPIKTVSPQQLRGVQIHVGCEGYGVADAGADAPVEPCTYNLELHDLRWYKADAQ